MNGRYCDNCEAHLNDEDYTGYGSWSYMCPECGFEYRHSSELTTSEQVKKYAAQPQAPTQADEFHGEGVA